MKWKRSRKAQQESKNKDKDSSDDKRDRSSNSSNHNSTFKRAVNEKVISSNAPSSFHFSKNSEGNLIHPHPGMPIQRHIMPGSSNEMLLDENYLNRQHQNVFSESDDMIWRVV